MNDPSYNPGACCGASCFAEHDDTPCWGDVEAIDEELVYGDDGEIEDSSWVHACEGHVGVWLWGEEYKPKPPTSKSDCSWCHGEGTVRSSIDIRQGECPCKWDEDEDDKPLPLFKKVGKAKMIFQSLTPEEYEAAPVPSKEKIRTALKKGSEDLRKAALSKGRRTKMPNTWQCYYCDVRYPFTVSRCDCGKEKPPQPSSSGPSDETIRYIFKRAKQLGITVSIPEERIEELGLGND